MNYYYCYQYDPNSGFIGATVSGSYQATDPFLQIPNQLVSPIQLVNSAGTIIISGMTFTLTNGQPTLDASGNYEAQ